MATKLGPAELIVSGADGAWSIDATTTDNGFLNCARSGHPGAKSHHTTQEAMANLASLLPGAVPLANLCGHGNDGLIVTGQGQTPTDPKCYINPWNVSFWRPFVQQLRGRCTVLKLWACHPGTGQAGVNLLSALSQTVGAQCMGITGFLYCGGGRFWLEPGSTWQVVTPGHPLPAPIEAPSPHLRVLKDDLVLIATDSGYDSVPITEVVQVSLVVERGPERVFDQDLARDWLRTIAFDAPFVVDGVPCALVTSRVNIKFTHDRERSYLVWNERMLEDATYPGNFYRSFAGMRIGPQH